MGFKHIVPSEQAALMDTWMKEHGGIAVWKSINLANPDTSWTTPLGGEKPNWQAANEPDRTITDPALVGVATLKEVKRLHMALRMGSQGLSLKLTDGSNRRLNAALAAAYEKYGKATYVFDHGTQDAVILVPDGQIIPLPEYIEKTGG